MKTKNILIGTALTGVLMCGGDLQSAAPAAKGNPSPWVANIVSDITKFGQTGACADGKTIRKLQMIRRNCATREGGAIAKIVCGTHDWPGRVVFWKGTCGTQATKSFGTTEDVGEYFEKAIDQGNVDAIALACKTPRDKLQGTLKLVANKKCDILGTPATAAVSKAIAEQAAEKSKNLKQSALESNPKLAPIAEGVLAAIKKLNNEKITDGMAINAANAVARAAPGLKLDEKVRKGMDMLGDLTSDEKISADAAIKAALRERGIK